MQLGRSTVAASIERKPNINLVRVGTFLDPALDAAIDTVSFPRILIEQRGIHTTLIVPRAMKVVGHEVHFGDERRYLGYVLTVDNLGYAWKSGCDADYLFAVRIDYTLVGIQRRSNIL